MVSVRECINLLSKPGNFLVIDARPEEEFNNKSPKDYLNNGRLKNAVNVSSVKKLLKPVVDKINKRSSPHFKVLALTAVTMMLTFAKH